MSYATRFFDAAGQMEAARNKPRCSHAHKSAIKGFIGQRLADKRAEIKQGIAKHARKEVVALTELQKIALARFEEEFELDRKKWFSAGEVKFRVPTLQALVKRGLLVERTGESSAAVYKLKG